MPLRGIVAGQPIGIPVTITNNHFLLFGDISTDEIPASSRHHPGIHQASSRHHLGII
jgi:hypothetical protein